AALLEEAGPAVLAFGYNDGDAMTVEDNNVKTQVDMVFTTDEDIPTPIDMQYAFVRLKGELSGMDLTPLSLTYAMPDLTIAVGAESVRMALGMATTDNELVEVLFQIPDESGDIAYVAREVIYDTTDPKIAAPLEGTVGVGSSELTVTIPGASDEVMNGVASGIGAFFVEFTSAVDAAEDPVTPPDDQAYATGNGSSFTITGLTNRVTYTFNVYALDNAGNRSVEFVADLEGTPAPGVSLLDLLGENGCVFSPRARGWGAGELLLWLGALAIALAVRRRGARA
ncbi:MAG: hypothetical protein KDH09_18130, partial [Chrysiogenetes bacterium]|nr:hypothetical protein [Chrysiogenetes bacterium]